MKSILLIVSCVVCVICASAQCTIKNCNDGSPYLRARNVSEADFFTALAGFYKYDVKFTRPLKGFSDSVYICASLKNLSTDLDYWTTKLSVTYKIENKTIIISKTESEYPIL